MSLLSKYYDVVWKTLPDKELILNLIKQTPAPLVDLGCGTGRVLRFAQEAGCESCGIDHDKEMLFEARKKSKLSKCSSVHLIEDDFVNVSFPGKAGLITCVANTFSMILDKQRRQLLLKNIELKLSESGKSLIWIATNHDALDGESETEYQTEEGTLVYTRSVFKNRADKTRTFNLSFEINGEFEKHSFVNKLISKDEMLSDIKVANLSLLNCYNDFDDKVDENSALYYVFIMGKK